MIQRALNSVPSRRRIAVLSDHLQQDRASMPAPPSGSSKTAGQFDAEVWVRKNGRGPRQLHHGVLLMLGAAPGAVIVLTARTRSRPGPRCGAGSAAECKFDED